MNKLPELPVGAVVTQATLDLYTIWYTGGSRAQFPVGLYEVTSGPTGEDPDYHEWIRYMTWNTKPTFDTDHVIDYEIVSPNTIFFKNNYGPVSWDLTELVKKWYHENTENRSFALSITSEDRDAGIRAAFAYYSYYDNASPTLIISYRNNVGIEPYYTYTTLGVGAAGTAYVADSTG